MTKASTRTYSRYSLEALALLAGRIRIARKERQMTAQNVAERAGISRGLLQRIEKGDPKCELGATLEVASIVGVKLFDTETSSLASYLRQSQDKLALLPKSVRKKVRVADDDF